MSVFSFVYDRLKFLITGNVYEGLSFLSTLGYVARIRVCFFLFLFNDLS